ncbi:MAG: (Fe-S)-binding protein [Bacilli bacterium]|nr:(Fe-S)-binding protein [Bacilli bacterium]
MPGIVIITSIAFILSVIISIIHYFINKEDTHLKEIEALLPGFNCNACGFGVCKTMAEKALIDADNLVKCRFLKEDKITEIKRCIKETINN